MRALTIAAALVLAPLAPALAQEEPPPAVPGQSPDEQAQRLADEAVDAYRTGRYEPAVKLFKQAYGLRADPAILYNLAKCFEKMDRPAEALEYYRRYLVAEGTDPKLRARAEEKVATLGAPKTQAAAQVTTAPPPPPPRPGRLLFYSGVGIAAAGAAGFLIGVSLYGAAASDYGTFNTSADGFDKRAARDHALALGKGSVAGYVVGAALLGAGGALVGLAVRRGFFRKEPPAKLALVPLPGGGAAVLGGVF